jgi:hypothetical protein
VTRRRLLGIVAGLAVFLVAGVGALGAPPAVLAVVALGVAFAYAALIDALCDELERSEEENRLLRLHRR